MDTQINHIKNVWQQAVILQNNKDLLLQYVAENSDILYLWVLKMAEGEDESCCIKIIEDLDDSFRDESDDLFSEYQPLHINLSVNEIEELKSHKSLLVRCESWVHA